MFGSFGRWRTKACAFHCMSHATSPTLVSHAHMKLLLCNHHACTYVCMPSVHAGLRAKRLRLTGSEASVLITLEMLESELREAVDTQQEEEDLHARITATGATHALRVLAEIL